mgnify:CR=1 FL=1
MEVEPSNTFDLLKAITVTLACYGAFLSTYNFLVTHYGRLIVEFTPETGDEILGTIRVLNVGRPRFVDEIIVQNRSGRTIKSEDIDLTFTRGQSRRIKLERRSFQQCETVRVVIPSERRKFVHTFTV